MSSAGNRKRKSDQLSTSNGQHQDTVNMTIQKLPTEDLSPQPQENPLKKRRVGITLAQKQALIDNLQLEITERARKLRANYNIHAQSLRTRIEIRVNRIPLALRKLTMGELLQKYSAEQQQKPAEVKGAARGPPVPAKDTAPSRAPARRALATTAPPLARPPKRPSHEISGGDKENEIEHIETPKKRARGNPATDISRYPGQVLSPTTSNKRMTPGNRTVATPARSGIARPVVTPGRAMVATNILNSMVEKARSMRVAATTRKTTTASTATTGTSTSSNSTTTNTTSGTTAAAARRKRGATVATAAAPPSRPATRSALRASGNSETSDGSTSTVVRRRPATAPPGAQPKLPPSVPATAAKRTVMGTIKKGVAATGTTRRGAAPKTAAVASASAATGTGRVLRKRG